MSHFSYFPGLEQHSMSVLSRFYVKYMRYTIPQKKSVKKSANQKWSVKMPPNSYYVESHNTVDFPEITSGGIPGDLPEQDVFKLLENIHTHKATSSADFASWISISSVRLLLISSTPYYPVANTPNYRNKQRCRLHQKPAYHI